MAEKYRGPLSVAMLLNDDGDVRDFIHYMIDGLEEMGLSGDDIPPIVYSSMGKTFNVDYNFMVSRLSEWMNDSLIIDDFKLSESSHKTVLNNAYFLVVSLLEIYHEVVRVRQKQIDISKYKALKTFNISDKFYNVLLMKNGENIRRFSAIPFSESATKKLISDEYFTKLMEFSSSSKYEQIAFGKPKYDAFCRENNIEPEHVFS